MFKYINQILTDREFILHTTCQIVKERNDSLPLEREDTSGSED
jgi:hypothetical protein